MIDSQLFLEAVFRGQRVAEAARTIPRVVAPTITPGTHIRVKVSAPFKVLTPLLQPITGKTVTMSRTVEVVVQG